MTQRKAAFDCIDLYSFEAVDPTAPDHDLAFLGPLIGDARVVALGEPTHGSSEVFLMKHRLFRYLVRNLGFTHLIMEADLAGSQQIDAYVQGKGGDPVQLLQALVFWPWATTEIADMIRWMRDHNQSCPRTAAVSFSGCDMQVPRRAAAAARCHLGAVCPDLLAAVSLAEGNLKRAILSDGFGSISGAYPPALLKGGTVRFRSQVKVTGISQGWAGLWWRADHKGRTIASDYVRAPDGGRREFETIELAFSPPPEADYVVLGVCLTGLGQVDFRELQLSVDGQSTEFADRFTRVQQSAGGHDPSALEQYHICRSETAEGLLISITREGLQSRLQSTLQEWDRIASELGRRSDAQGERPAADEVAACDEVRTVRQFLRRKLGQTTRDACMAENILCQLARYPSARFVLWAHNGHLARQPGSLGAYLDEALGQQCLIAGFATGHGTFRALGRGMATPSCHDLEPPPASSAEAQFASTKLPFCVADLRPARIDPRGPFMQPQLFRRVGAIVRGGQFEEHILARDFDLMLWLAGSSGSKPLPSMPAPQ